MVKSGKTELPNGEVIDDYFVTIRPEVALILPVTQQPRDYFGASIQTWCSEFC